MPTQPAAAEKFILYRCGGISFPISPSRIRWSHEWIRWEVFRPEKNTWEELDRPELYQVTPTTTLRDLKPECVNR